MSVAPQYFGRRTTLTRSPGSIGLSFASCNSRYLQRARPYESSLDVVKETVCPATLIIHEDVGHEEYLTKVLGAPIVIVL